MTTASISRTKNDRSLARAALAGFAIAAVLVTARPLSAHAWASGTDSAELANRIAELLQVKPGDTIAEVGAGHGYMAVRMAEKVGPAGHLYATEIDPDELTEIPRRAADAGLANVMVVKASVADTGLAAGCCDGIYMTDVYHHFEDPIATDKSIFAALKPGGRLFISDFYPTWLFAFWTTPAMRRNFGGHGVAEPRLVSQLSGVGFMFVEQIPGYPSKWPSGSYSVVMEKPATAPSASTH
jgi:ubiquinone/menaquinone biosynthesis C-methylase UbiE